MKRGENVYIGNRSGKAFSYMLILLAMITL